MTMIVTWLIAALEKGEISVPSGPSNATLKGVPTALREGFPQPSGRLPAALGKPSRRPKSVSQVVRQMRH
ncbi:hypothetical protein N9L68_08360, partial [bacterium]|nr:hypothetical protein [bacterium]